MSRWEFEDPDEPWQNDRNPQPEVEGGNLHYRRGLGEACRCVFNPTQLLGHARHPECPRHPPRDELGFWDAVTVPVGDYL